MWLFFAVPWVCLQFVNVVFPDNTHYFTQVLLYLAEEERAGCYSCCCVGGCVMLIPCGVMARSVSVAFPGHTHLFWIVQNSYMFELNLRFVGITEKCVFVNCLIYLLPCNNVL